MKLLIINHAGDVRDAYHGLASGRPETYYRQRYLIETYAGMQEFASEVGVLVCLTQQPYEEVLPNGLRALGAGLTNRDELSSVYRRISHFAPTHVVLTSQDRRLVRWLARRDIRCLAAFAGSIPNGGNLKRRLLNRVRNAEMAFWLNRPNFEWVGSYGTTSARLLASAGVQRNKLIPWDYLIEPDSGPLPVKTLHPGDQGYSVCYVGTIVESKGVGDLLDAIAVLKQQGFPMRATIVGNDAEGLVRARIDRYGLHDRVTLPGLVANDRIEPLMHGCDLVAIPSRPEYPEGFPLVIHHALRARTPIVASDHPMFVAHLEHGKNSVLFPAANPEKLAEAMRRLLADQELYARISANSDATWRQLRLPVKWLDLIQSWMRDTPRDRAWLGTQTLAATDARSTAS